MSKPIDCHNRGINGNVSANLKPFRTRNNSPQFIESLKRGEAAAFNQLVASENQHLVDFMMPILNSKENAEELAQDIFLYIWQNRATLDFGNNIFGYIYST